MRNDTESAEPCFEAFRAASIPLVQYRGGYGERAWVAWHSLDERDELRGGPVVLRELERRHGLNQGELTRFVRGEYKEPSYRVVVAAAAALRTTTEWLMQEIGEGPRRAHYLGVVPKWPGPRKSAQRDTSKRSRIRKIAER